MRDQNDDLDQVPTEEHRIVTAQDVMHIIRETQKKGFAFREIVEVGKDKTFQSQQMFVVDDVPVPQDDDTADHISSLSDLVAKRVGHPEDASVLTHADTTDPAETQPLDVLEEPTEPEPLFATMDEAYERGKSDGFSDGFAQGFDEGKAKGTLDAQHDFLATEFEQAEQAKLEELSQTIARMNKTAAQVETEITNESAVLAEHVARAVLDLVNERVGAAITEHPTEFMTKIETLAERITTAASECSIVLNEQDHAALAPHINASEYLSVVKISSDPSLDHGDVQIRAGAIKLRDALRQ